MSARFPMMLIALASLSFSISDAAYASPIEKRSAQEMAHFLVGEQHPRAPKVKTTQLDELKRMLHSTAESAEDSKKIYECFQTLLGAPAALAGSEGNTKSDQQENTSPMPNLRGIPSTAIMALTFEAQGENKLANETYLRASHQLTDPAQRVPANLLPLFQATSDLLLHQSKSTFGSALREQVQEIIVRSKSASTLSPATLKRLQLMQIHTK